MAFSTSEDKTKSVENDLSDKRGEYRVGQLDIYALVIPDKSFSSRHGNCKLDLNE